MKRRRALVVLLLGCSCRSSSSPSEGAPDASADAPITADAGPPLPALTIENRGPGQFVLRANSSVKIATKAVIERRTDGENWKAYDEIEGGKGYRLAACGEKEVPACRSLGAGAEVRPEPWSGLVCAAQCAELCATDPLRVGTHRLVVTMCDAPSTRFVSLPFEIPASAATLARQQATFDVERATVARLDPRAATDATDAGGDRRAGYAVIAGTELPLGVDDRAELAKWLRNQDAFKEGIEKRCARKQMVGFALTASGPAGKERRTEVAVDFGCSAIVVAHEQGGRRVVTSSFFDPSRSVIAAIASRGLPADKELAKLE